MSTSCARRRKKYTYSFIVIGINYETAGTSPGSRKSSYFLVNQKQTWKMFKTRYIVHPGEMYQHDRFSCNDILSSYYLFSLARYEWTLTYSSYSKNENQPQYSLNHNPKNLLTNLFTSRVCSQSTLIKFGYHGFHLKKVENSISIWFFNWRAAENLVVNN